MSSSTSTRPPDPESTSTAHLLSALSRHYPYTFGHSPSKPPHTNEMVSNVDEEMKTVFAKLKQVADMYEPNIIKATASGKKKHHSPRRSSSHRSKSDRELAALIQQEAIKQEQVTQATLAQQSSLISQVTSLTDSLSQLASKLDAKDARLTEITRELVRVNAECDERKRREEEKDETIRKLEDELARLVSHNASLMSETRSLRETIFQQQVSLARSHDQPHDTTIPSQPSPPPTTSMSSEVAEFQRLLQQALEEVKELQASEKKLLEANRVAENKLLQTKSVEEDLMRQLSAIRQQVERLEEAKLISASDRQRMTLDMKQKDQQVEQANARLHQLESLLQAQNDELSQWKQAVTVADIEKKNLHQEINAARSEVESLRRDLLEHQRLVSDHTTQQTIWRQEMNMLKTEAKQQESKLKQQMKEALTTRDHEWEVRLRGVETTWEAKAIGWNTKEERYHTEMTEKQKTIRDLESELQSKTKDNIALRDRIDQLKRELSTTTTKLNTLYSEMEDIRITHERTQRDAAAREERLTHSFIQKEAALVADMNTWMARAENAEHSVKKMEDELANRLKQNSQLTRKLDELTTELSDKKRSHRRKLQQVKDRYMILRNKMEEIKSTAITQIKLMQTQQRQMRQEVVTLLAQAHHNNTTQLHSDLSVLSNTITDLRDASTQLASHVEHQRQQNRVLQDTVAVREAQREEMQRELESRKTTIEELTRKLGSVQQLYDRLKSDHAAQHRHYKALLTSKSNSLAELGYAQYQFQPHDKKYADSKRNISSATISSDMNQREAAITELKNLRSVAQQQMDESKRIHGFVDRDLELYVNRLDDALRQVTQIR